MQVTLNTKQRSPFSGLYLAGCKNLRKTMKKCIILLQKKMQYFTAENALFYFRKMQYFVAEKNALCYCRKKCACSILLQKKVNFTSETLHCFTSEKTHYFTSEENHYFTSFCHKFLIRGGITMGQS